MVLANAAFRPAQNFGLAFEFAPPEVGPCPEQQRDGADMIPGRIVEVGGVPVLLRVEDRALQEAVDKWYADYLTTKPSAEPFELTVKVAPDGGGYRGDQTRVETLEGRWLFEGFDFRAEWFPGSGRGWVRQEWAFHQSIDSVLRVLHSILLAPKGGCLLHAASAVRNGRAFAFTGVSGAGKTTLARLAPPDVVLLTDEISYIRSVDGVYRAFGTPFAGERRAKCSVDSIHGADVRDFVREENDIGGRQARERGLAGAGYPGERESASVAHGAGGVQQAAPFGREKG